MQATPAAQLRYEDFITISEAAALLPRKRGKKVHYQSVIRWSGEDTFEVFQANGKKVRKTEFLAWARRAGKLPPEPLRLGVAG